MKNYFTDKNKTNSMKPKTPLIQTIAKWVQLLIILSYLVMCVLYQFDLEYDTYKTDSQSVDLSELGEIKLFKESKLVPVIEVKIIGDVSRFDIFQDFQKQQPKGGNVWDIKNYVDYAKLRKYIKIEIVQAYKFKGKSYFYKKEFQQCKENDFIVDGQKIQSNIDHKLYFCPNMDSIRESFGLKNGYSDDQDRMSFSIEIITCSGTDCKSQSDIKDLIDCLIINNYWIYTQVNFKSRDNLTRMPVKHFIKFYQQFRLDYERYRDNNNFVKVVNIKTNDYRDRMFFDESKYRIFDLVQAMIFNAKKHVIQINATTNFKDFQVETRHTLQASFYFLMNQETNHERQVYTFFDLFSQIGGFQSGLDIFNDLFISQIAHTLIVGYIMNKLYTARKEDDTDNESASQNPINQCIFITDNKQKERERERGIQGKGEGNNEIKDQKYRVSQNDDQIMLAQKAGNKNIQEYQNIEQNVFVHEKNMIFVKSEDQFSILERIGNIWFMYPLAFVLKKLNYLKNQDKFEEVKEYIENELEDTMNLANSQKIYILENQNAELKRQVQELYRMVKTMGSTNYSSCKDCQNQQKKNNKCKNQSSGQQIVFDSSSELKCDGKFRQGLLKDVDQDSEQSQQIDQSIQEIDETRQQHQRISIQFFSPKKYISTEIK